MKLPKAHSQIVQSLFLSILHEMKIIHSYQFLIIEQVPEVMIYLDMCFLLVSTPDQKKIDFFVPSNITSHYTCYCSILKAIFILAEERSATFSRHSKLCNHPSYLKNGSSVFHTISILSSPLIITFLITFWIFSLSKDSILMILSNCVSNLLEELSSGGISVLSCSIS